MKEQEIIDLKMKAQPYLNKEIVVEQYIDTFATYLRTMRCRFIDISPPFPIPISNPDQTIEMDINGFLLEVDNEEQWEYRLKGIVEAFDFKETLKVIL